MGAVFLLFFAATILPAARADAPIASCASSPRTDIEALTEAARSEACRSFDPYLDVPVPADPAAPVDCAEYGLVPGRKIRTLEDALALDCDVLEYRPTPPGSDLANDPLGDLALACRALRARQNLSLVLAAKGAAPGSKAHQKIEGRNLRSSRARICAIQAFGAAYEKPLDQKVERAAGELLEWGDREADLARIDAAGLPDERSRELHRQVAEGELSLQGRRKPVDREGFLAMVNQVIADEYREGGLEPSLGAVPEWSPAFRQCLGRRFAWTAVMGKQLMVLGIGRGDHFTPTGDEPALHAWILSREDFSIEPEELFRHAYRLAAGDVNRAVRTIENVLSRHWTTADRGQLVQTRKLRPITNTIGSADDVFGSWYHFFGIMLYGLGMKNPVKAPAVARIETLGGHVLSGFTAEPQEDRINRQGAAIGGDLRRSIERGDWRAITQADPGVLEFDAYMNLDEDFSRRLRRDEVRNQPVEHTSQDP